MRRLLGFIGECLLAVLCLLVILGSYAYVSAGSLDRLVEEVSNLARAAGVETDLLPDDATPSIEVPDDQHGLWYDQLTDSERSAYDQMLLALVAMEESLAVRDVTPDEAERAFRAIIGDHPEFFWLTGAFTYRQQAGSRYLDLTPQVSCSKEEAVALKGQIEDAAAQVVGQCGDGSDYDKARTCYEWIIDWADYGSSGHDQTIQGVMVDGAAVCAGYARTFQYLMHQMGISCAYLSGGSHAWNLVWIEGTPTYVDVTWGDPVFMAENGEMTSSSIVYDYFCLTADELYRNHVLEAPVSNLALLPTCDSTAYDYYRLNGCYLEGFSPDELVGVIDGAAAEGTYAVHIKFGSDEALQEALAYVVQHAYEIDGLAGVTSLRYGGNSTLHILYLEW